jgi:hypothetical protein
MEFKFIISKYFKFKCYNEGVERGTWVNIVLSRGFAQLMTFCKGSVLPEDLKNTVLLNNLRDSNEKPGSFG